MIPQKTKEHHIRSSQNTVSNIAKQFSNILDCIKKQEVVNLKADIKPKKLADYIRQRSESRKKHQMMSSNPQALAQQQKNEKIRKKKSQLNDIIQKIIKFLKELKSAISNNIDSASLQTQEFTIKQIHEIIKGIKIYESELANDTKNEKVGLNNLFIPPQNAKKKVNDSEYISPKYKLSDDKKQKLFRSPELENQYFTMQLQNYAKNNGTQKLQKSKYIDFRTKVANKKPEMQILQNQTGLTSSNYLEVPNYNHEFSQKFIKNQKINNGNLSVKQQKQLLQQKQERKKSISIQIKQSNLKKFK